MSVKYKYLSNNILLNTVYLDHPVVSPNTGYINLDQKQNPISKEWKDDFK